MRGDLPPRTSELILEILKMLTCAHRRTALPLAVCLVVVAGNDHRRIGRKLGDALEHVLGRVGREVGDQLVVDRQVRRQHEEVVDAVRQVQIADERAHQPRLAHARGERKAQRRKLALEVRDRRELAANRFQRGRSVAASAPFRGGAISVMRSSISSERRCGGRRLRRPAMALTWRFIAEIRARPVLAISRRHQRLVPIQAVALAGSRGAPSTR